MSVKAHCKVYKLCKYRGLLISEFLNPNIFFPHSFLSEETQWSLLVNLPIDSSPKLIRMNGVCHKLIKIQHTLSLDSFD